MSFLLKCRGCNAWQTPGHMSGLYYIICDCGTVTTIYDSWEGASPGEQAVQEVIL